MTTPRRKVVAVAAAALALAGCGGDTAGPRADRPQPTPSPAQATPGDALAADDAESEADAGSDADDAASPGQSSRDDPASDEGAGQDADVQAAVEVEGGRVHGDVQDIAADVGDTVELTVTSDGADEVHVHGYDLHAPVAPGQPATVAFQGDIPGVFEIELEQRGLAIAELTVGG